MQKEKPVALITGASSGFGLETGRELLRRGWRVFGTSRKKLLSAVPGMEMLELDVRCEESVQRAVSALLAAAGRIDALVNNAGYVLNGFAEEASLDQVRQILDTNFLGAVRLINAILPAMRTRRSGKIINVTSIAGRAGVVYRSFYAASKFAMEGYSESLRYELLPFGIHVSIVEPGFFRTHLDAASEEAQNRIADYDPIREKPKTHFTRGVRKGGNPARVGRLIARIAESNRPALRYRIGTDAVWLPLARTGFPESLYAQGVRRMFQLDPEKIANPSAP